MIKFLMTNNKNQEFDLEKYTNEVMTKVENILQGYDLEFYSNKKRIRKCSLGINGNTYFIFFTLFVTSDVMQLKVDISQQTSRVFDQTLHELKINLKDFLIIDWEQCTWIEDSQSEEFAENLYRDIHSIENKLRNLINTVLSFNLGWEWWDKFMPEHLINTYNKRRSEYQRQTPSFKGIQTNLLSIDTGDLIRILEHKTYKLKDKNVFNDVMDCYILEDELDYIFGSQSPEEEKELKANKENQETFNRIMNNLWNDQTLIEQHQKKLVELLKGQMVEDVSFWNRYFAKWFSCDLREFTGRWSSFSRDRNHVAHNKLIDDKLYHKFKKSMSDLLSHITDAQEKFEVHLEKEAENYLEELEAQQQGLEWFREYEEEKAIKEMIAEETGVQIRDEEEIIELLKERITGDLAAIEDYIYYREDIVIQTKDLGFNSETTPIKIDHFPSGDSIKIQAKPDISEEPGHESNVDFLVFYNNELIKDFSVTYVNGDYEYDEESTTYKARVENHLDLDGIEQLKEFIVKLVAENMPLDQKS